MLQRWSGVSASIWHFQCKEPKMGQKVLVLSQAELVFIRDE